MLVCQVAREVDERTIVPRGCVFDGFQFSEAGDHDFRRDPLGMRGVVERSITRTGVVESEGLEDRHRARQVGCEPGNGLVAIDFHDSTLRPHRELQDLRMGRLLPYG